MSIGVFVDRAPWVDANPEFKRLFDEMGCEAYFAIDAIQRQEAMEREERDYLSWAPNIGLTEDDEDEDGFDLGPEEPDEYGDEL